MSSLLSLFAWPSLKVSELAQTNQKQQLNLRLPNDIFILLRRRRQCCGGIFLQLWPAFPSFTNSH